MIWAQTTLRDRHRQCITRLGVSSHRYITTHYGKAGKIKALAAHYSSHFGRLADYVKADRPITRYFDP